MLISHAIRLMSGVLPPLLLSSATNTTGNQVILTFDKAMANPSGKQGEFSVIAGGSSVTISSASLDTDNKKIVLYTSTLISYGQTVTVSYTKGTVTSADGGHLASFSNVSVVNNVSPYQQWSSFPNSPLLTTDYPYQFIDDYSGSVWQRLLMSQTPIYKNGSSYGNNSSNNFKMAYRDTSNNGNWQAVSNVGNPSNSGYTLKEANNPVYTDSTKTTVYFAKTTP